MITSLCMNPCIDRTLNLAAFTYGGMNRAESVNQDGAGKGVNVALAGSQTGLSMGCIGVLGRENGYLVTDRLRGAGIAHEFVMRPGAIRCNTKIVDTSTHQVTEINEAGEPVGSGCLAEVLELCGKWLRKAAPWCCQAPCRHNARRIIMRRLWIMRRGGRRLRAGRGMRKEKLWPAQRVRSLISSKPNPIELETLCGRQLDSPEQAAEEGAKLLERGVQHVAISLGREGVLGLSGKEVWYAPALPCPVQSTVGAGDSMLAAMTRRAAGGCRDRAGADLRRGPGDSGRCNAGYRLDRYRTLS